MQTLYRFFAEEGLVFLKSGYFPFQTVQQMPEPWLKDNSLYISEQEETVVSDQVFDHFLREQYAKLPGHLKDIVTFDYFEQQSQDKRAEIEKQLLNREQSLADADGFSVERLSSWRILSLFESWQNINLWQCFAAEGKGLVVELSIAESGFNENSYNQQAQHLAAVKQVGPWLPEDDLYYLFNKPSGQHSEELSNHKAEREWRLLRHKDAADRTVMIQKEEVAMYRLPRKAVSRVILGYRCDPDYCQRVKHYLAQDINYRHTECMQVQINPHTMRLELVKIA